jgi:hypothetical protein
MGTSMSLHRATQCQHRCPGGAPCILNAEVPHTLHICHKAGCACHSAQRYQPGAIVEPGERLTQAHRPVLAQARIK